MTGSLKEEGLVVLDVEETLEVVGIAVSENVSQEDVVDVGASSETVSLEDVDDIVASLAILQSRRGEADGDDTSSLLITDCEDMDEDIELSTSCSEGHE